MLARELSIALRSRLTWMQAVLSALLVGHGFVLAIDIYSAGSHSVQAHTLMAREFDPLLGIVRPTFGGLYVSVSLLGPLVAARVLASEKERRTLHAVLLQTGAPLRLLGSMFVGAVTAVGLQLLAPVLLLALFALLGGHLALAETLVLIAGHGLYVASLAAIALMAAAWTRNLGQAASVSVLLVLSSWAIDASEGFAALGWLRRAVNWSVTPHLEALEHGTLWIGACLFFVALSVAALALAWVGLHYDRSPGWRAGAVVIVVAAMLTASAAVQKYQRGFDLTEAGRASLPPAVVDGLRALHANIALDVWLDSDDARRQEFERDALSKLRLARPDIAVRTPTDDSQQSERDERYGRILVHVGGSSRETYSTSRRELATLIFEAAGRALPSFEQPEYAGYPTVIDGSARTLAVVVAYLGAPALMLVLGWAFTRSRRMQT